MSKHGSQRFQKMIASAYAENGNNHDNLVDLLTDARHWADQKRIDFHEALDKSYANYCEDQYKKKAARIGSIANETINVAAIEMVQCDDLNTEGISDESYRVDLTKEPGGVYAQVRLSADRPKAESRDINETLYRTDFKTGITSETERHADVVWTRIRTAGQWMDDPGTQAEIDKLFDAEREQLIEYLTKQGWSVKGKADQP